LKAKYSGIRAMAKKRLAAKAHSAHPAASAGRSDVPGSKPNRRGAIQPNEQERGAGRGGEEGDDLGLARIEDYLRFRGLVFGHV